MVREIDAFVGISYKPVRFENLEELYDATGIDDGCLGRRRYYSKKLSTLHRKQFSEYYSFTSFSSFDFKPDKFYWELWNGNGLCKSVVTFEDNKMIQKQKGTKDIQIIREFSDNEMIMTVSVDGVIARIYFEKSFDFSGKKVMVMSPNGTYEPYKL